MPSGCLLRGRGRAGSRPIRARKAGGACNFALPANVPLQYVKGTPKPLGRFERLLSARRAATDMRAIPFPRCAVTRAVATRAPVHAYGSFGAWRVSLGRAPRLP